MTVRGYLALLVGVLVVALATVTVAQREVVGDLGLKEQLQRLAATVSIGAAAGTDDGWEGLVRRADTGLYAAKEGGRDRVVAGPAAHRGATPAGSRSFTPEGQDAARYR
jgi:predicted signal transduction protein with EAL and GGDEF domain